MKSRLVLVSIIVSAFVVGSYVVAPALFANASGKMPVIGWLDSNCFAVAKKGLPNGTELFVVTLDGPQAVASATIIGPANAESCGPMAADRREYNLSQGLSFYDIKSSTPFGTAIGILAKVTNAKVSNENVLADINNDGKPEQFSMCATSEGLSFDVWKSAPFKTKALWSGYYYLGYDVERTCP